MEQLCLEIGEAILKKIALWCDEVELLCILETRFVSSIKFSPISSFDCIQTSNYLVTAIKDGQLARLSWITSGAEFPLRQISYSSFKEAFSRGEVATYPLNPNMFMPSCSLSMYRDTALKAQEIQAKTYSYYECFTKDWPTYNVRVLYENLIESCCLFNTLGLRGSYEHSSESLGFRMVDQEGKKDITGIRYKLDSPWAVLADLESKIIKSKKKVQTTIVRKGRSSLLLCPNIVGILCSVIFDAAVVGTKKNRSFFSALPDHFELHDKPELNIGMNAVPFDHEGTLTHGKLICQGSELINFVSDLKKASMNHCKSSGNGFRRGSFQARPGDVAPSIKPNYLYLSPGKMSLEEVVRDTKEFVCLERIILPLDRFQDLQEKGSIYTLVGNYIKNQNVVSGVFAQNYARRPLLTSYPETYGSLLDKKSVILTEGEYTRIGWFPYIFVPEFTWA